MSSVMTDSRALPAAPWDPDFLRSVLDHLQDGVYFVDRARRITYWNAGAERITGYPPAEVLGHCCADNLLNHVDDAGCELCLHGCPLTAAMRGDRVGEQVVFLRHRAGHRVPVRVRVAPIRDARGEVIGAVESFSDGTLQAEAERSIAELRRSLLTDPLTGVGNRRLLDSRAAGCIAERAVGIPAGALFVDLDHFKAVNDTHGHATGDALLGMVARTLARSVRAEDTVARAGGEEFVLLLQGVDVDELTAKAEMLRAMVVASGIDGPAGTVRVTVSIGGALAGPTESAPEWLDRADRALYRAKQRGRNQVAMDRWCGDG